MFRFSTKLAPSPTSLERAWNAGFRNTELWLDEDQLRDIEPAIRSTTDHRFRYVPHFPNRGQFDIADLERTAQLYRGLDCGCLVIHQPMKSRYEHALLDIDPGMVLAVENGRQQGNSFRRWAERHDHLTLDVEHLWKFTLSDAPFAEMMDFLAEFLEEFGHKVRHVHLPGYLIGAPEHRPAYVAPELSETVWGALADFGYEGFVVSEADPEFQTDLHLRRDVILFDRWFADYSRSAEKSGKVADFLR